MPQIRRSDRAEIDLIDIIELLPVLHGRQNITPRFLL